MPLRTYYHNISKSQINELCWVDFWEAYEVGDIIYKSFDGNGCLREFEAVELEQMQSQYLQYLDDCKEAETTRFNKDATI